MLKIIIAIQDRTWRVFFDIDGILSRMSLPDKPVGEWSPPAVEDINTEGCLCE